jgi:hypothetical protein
MPTWLNSDDSERLLAMLRDIQRQAQDLYSGKSPLTGLSQIVLRAEQARLLLQRAQAQRRWVV